jgi:hypothetical protein
MHAGRAYNDKTMTLERFGFIGTDKKCFWGMIGVDWLTPLKIQQIKPGKEVPKKPKAPTPPSTAKLCKVEGGSCNCKGNLWYGKNGKYVSKKTNGLTACTNGVFGDPIPGIKKECLCDGTIVKPPAPPAIKQPYLYDAGSKVINKKEADMIEKLHGHGQYFHALRYT